MVRKLSVLELAVTKMPRVKRVCVIIDKEIIEELCVLLHYDELFSSFRVRTLLHQLHELHRRKYGYSR